MKDIIPPRLRALAGALSAPLYAVGGSVRDALCHTLGEHIDWDIASPATETQVCAAAEACGFCVRAVYPRTGTVKLDAPEGFSCEYTRFRTDKYVRGVHMPAEIAFTDDISLDARRRDFCANAVYYDIAADRYCDPLDGISDIRMRKLRTVAPAEKVFGEDGLRLMRLARIAAQTGFEPDAECLEGASLHRALIRDIAPERIFCEMQLLLHADERAGGKRAPLRGLCILRDTGVLDEVLPELCAGRGMAQRADFHDHDVLEHSLRCVYYSAPAVRWAALLHDVGKPFCMRRDGNFYAHAEEGARIAQGILTRLKAPAALTQRTARLISLHMRDHDMKMRENKVRRDILENYALIDDLFALRRADYSACKDDLSPAPGVLKWQRILAAMREEGVPFTLKDLAVTGVDLTARGIRGERVGALLHELLLYCMTDGRRNTRPGLLKHIDNLKKE